MVRGSVLALALSACAPSPDAPVTPPAAAASTSSASSRPMSSAAPVASIPPPGTADAWTAASPVVETPEPAAAVTADGRVDGDRLRRLHLDRLARDESPVVVLQGGTPRELGARLCEQVVPRRPPDTPVLLKPNVCGFQALRKVRAPEDDDGLRGRITDPEFTRGVIDCLKARGHQRITVAEGCAVDHAMFEKVMARSGYAAMAAEAGVPLVGLDDDGVFDAVGERPGKPLRVSGMEQSHVPQLLLPKILVEHLDHGLFLSLPKIKAHRFSVVSLGIKGTQGVVMRSDEAPAHQQKWRMHAELHRYLSAAKSGHEDRAAYVASLELFSDRLLDVLEVAMPHAVLAEGAPAMGGDGFDLLVPLSPALAVGGSHIVRVDMVGSQLLGLWQHPTLKAELGGYHASPLIVMAARRWSVDLDATRLVGSGAPLVALPRPAHYRAMAPFAIAP